MIYYNTCLRPENENFPEAGEAFELSKADNFRYEHVHRKWEYGLALKFAREIRPDYILNVGGGNSPLSFLLKKDLNCRVREIDQSNEGQPQFKGIEYITKPFPVQGLGKYDLIVCTSVIEHVENDKKFFEELLDHANHGVFITTDFHPSGETFSQAHLRTYNAERMMDFINTARVLGFMPYGSIHYLYEKPMVYDYTFAALALHRKKPTHV